MYKKWMEAPDLHNMERVINRCYYIKYFLVAGASSV